MKIGGFLKQSLIDYPGKISCIVFTIGCNFRCPYCHNPELVLPGKAVEFPEKEVFDHLKKSKKFIDAVVITGGEPTLQPDLTEFVKKVKELGFLVKLDTNGTHPATLRKLVDLNLVDYVAMDIKAPMDFEKQNTSVGGVLSKELYQKTQESTEILRKSGLPHEFRTTVVPRIHTTDDIVEICKYLKGEENFAIQQFRPGKTLDKSFSGLKPFDQNDLGKTKNSCEKFIKNVTLKGV